jgi:hypothetical protein
MIDFNNQVSHHIDNINAIHGSIEQLNIQALSVEETKNWETELQKIKQSVVKLYAQNLKHITEPIGKNLDHSICILTNDLEAMQLTLLFKGYEVNCPIQSYMEKYPLEKRVLILGCGHRQDPHLHEGAYCLDLDVNMRPDAKIDITTSVMNYLPTGSFPKIILESLPSNIFDDNQWKGVFTQLHRILAEAGNKIEFNNMFDLDTESDFDNMFNLVISEEELNTLNEKRIKECPKYCFKYNKKLKKCFRSINFALSQEFDMKTLPDHYTICKL